ncbi:hypothetical protein RMCBS344292_10125 [Rhizopus microsporus]|nr:hypothetical protein RMCBS344292_10125 [Rhizopus microsporus]
MTDKLPPNLLKLFAPRPPLPYYPPLDKDPSKRAGCRVTGIASYVPLLKDHDPDYVPWKSLAEKRKEKAEAKRKKAEEDLQKALAEYDPEKDENITGDPFNTLFVTHLSPELTESDLQREFEVYGHIKKVTKKCQAKFEREKDMRAAYKDADGLKILGRRILVDVERARTVKGWRPRRLGGGLGGREQKAANTNSSYKDRHHDRGYSRHGYNRRDDDRKRSRMRSRSRSPRGYRDRGDRYRGRDRSRDRPRRDRY